jgi:anti-sigma factor RsiW
MMLRWFRRRSGDLVCVEFVEIVTDYLEGALPVAERDRFERHFAACPHCGHHLAQLRVTIRATGRLRVDDVDALAPSAREELLAAFRSYQAE